MRRAISPSPAPRHCARRFRAKLAAPVAIENEEAECAREVALPLAIHRGDESGNRRAAAPRELMQILPERLLEREAGRMPGNHDRALAQRAHRQLGPIIASVRTQRSKSSAET